jgi:hypothetical protein
VVDRQVVPQHVAHLVRVDPVPELAGLVQVAGQCRHAGQALVVHLRPDRGQRVVHVPAVTDEDLDSGRTGLALRQPGHEHLSRPGAPRAR